MKIFYVFLPDNYYTRHLKKKKKTVTLTAVVNVRSDKIGSLCGDDGHSDDRSDDSRG